MEDISKIIGQRIRGYRKMKHLSQEQLAEKCELHPTYIGQLERGEKNATLETIQRISRGLDVSLEQLFTNISPKSFEGDAYIPNRIMLLVEDLSPKDQMIIYNFIMQALKLKS